MQEVDLVASSALGESDSFASSDRLDVLDSDRCASSERLEVRERDLCASSDRSECRDVERSSRLLLLWSPQALPLLAGMNVVEDPISGMENRGGGVSSCRSRYRRSVPSSTLSPLSLRPSEGMMVVEPEAWKVELCVEFMESEKRRFLTVASSTPRRSQGTRPEGGRGRVDTDECLVAFSGSFSGSSPPVSEWSEGYSGFSVIWARGLE